MATATLRPLCFVIMPFGKKSDPNTGGVIDFDVVYKTAIHPAIEAAGLEPIRADEEQSGGIIHKPMYERLLLCDYAVADITLGNPNVFYELGIRHAVRPGTTEVIYASSYRHPFDVNSIRSTSYALDANHALSSDEAKKLADRLAQRLRDDRNQGQAQPLVDSPLFQLLGEYKAPDLARLKTDAFRDQVEYSRQAKEALAKARAAKDLAALQAIEASLPLEGTHAGHGGGRETEAGVLVDLLVSYRALSAWQSMIDLFGRLPAVLQKTVLVREQYALALNRNGDGAKALAVLQTVIEDQGPSSETCGLIGRVHKDRWSSETAKARSLAEAGRAAESNAATISARGHLKEAIRWYTQGFETDPRDAYPGINALTLLDLQGTPDGLARKAKMAPVVRYAVERRLQQARPDYWDHATLLELAVLEDDRDGAEDALATALAGLREGWEAKTTANNLGMIRDARAARGVDVGWLEGIISVLLAKSA